MGLRPLLIFVLFQWEDRLWTSESDVYRRQILTYKDGPRTERVKMAAKMAAMRTQVRTRVAKVKK